MSQIIGEIIQVIGPVMDVSFEKAMGELPRIHDALEIKRSGGQSVVLEVQQDIGENTVRTIAMDSTDGLQRGMTVTALGSAIRLSMYDTPTLVHFCSTSHKNTPTLVHFYATSHKSTLTSVRFYATSHKSTSMSVRFYATSLYDTPTSVYFCATSVYETPTSVSATS